jgi:hypothetical protein
MADDHEDQVESRYYAADSDCIGYECDQQGTNSVDEKLSDP